VKLKRDGDPREHIVEIISRDGAALRVRVGDREIATEFVADSNGGAAMLGILTIDGRRYVISGARRKDLIIAGVGPASFEFKPAESGARRHARGLAAPEITAPMPGKVLKLMVVEGDAVEARRIRAYLCEGGVVLRQRRTRAQEGEMSGVRHHVILVLGR
jgi:biotin carboxyl carrier protein